MPSITMASREAVKDSAQTKALIKAMQSPEVRAIIEKDLEPKDIVPAF